MLYTVLGIPSTGATRISTGPLDPPVHRPLRRGGTDYRQPLRSAVQSMPSPCRCQDVVVQYTVLGIPSTGGMLLQGIGVAHPPRMWYPC